MGGRLPKEGLVSKIGRLSTCSAKCCCCCCAVAAAAAAAVLLLLLLLLLLCCCCCCAAAVLLLLLCCCCATVWSVRRLQCNNRGGDLLELRTSIFVWNVCQGFRIMLIFWPIGSSVVWHFGSLIWGIDCMAFRLINLGY